MRFLGEERETHLPQESGRWGSRQEQEQDKGYRWREARGGARKPVKSRGGAVGLDLKGLNGGIMVFPAAFFYFLPRILTMAHSACIHQAARSVPGPASGLRTPREASGI